MNELMNDASREEASEKRRKEASSTPGDASLLPTRVTCTGVTRE